MGKPSAGRPKDFWWACPSCTGWEWQRNLQCRKCQAFAPKWVAQHVASAGRKSDAKSDDTKGKGSSRSKSKGKGRGNAGAAAQPTEQAGDANSVAAKALDKHLLLARIKRMEESHK
eukprot:5257441-Amphidinium_carterae.1